MPQQEKIQQVCRTHKVDSVIVVGNDVFLTKNKTLAIDHAKKTNQEWKEVSLTDLEVSEVAGSTYEEESAKEPTTKKSTTTKTK